MASHPGPAETVHTIRQSQPCIRVRLSEEDKRKGVTHLSEIYKMISL